jgi:hypothetical protein
LPSPLKAHSSLFGFTATDVVTYWTNERDKASGLINLCWRSRWWTPHWRILMPCTGKHNVNWFEKIFTRIKMLLSFCSCYNFFNSWRRQLRRTDDCRSASHIDAHLLWRVIWPFTFKLQPVGSSRPSFPILSIIILPMFRRLSHFLDWFSNPFWVRLLFSSKTWLINRSIKQQPMKLAREASLNIIRLHSN